MMLKTHYLIALVVLLCSCGNKHSNTTAGCGDTLRLKYAKHLQIIAHKDYYEVNVLNPWKEGTVLHRYFLAEKQGPEREGTTIITPLKKLLIYTAAHCGLMYDLGARESVAGVCDKQYIMATWVKDLPDCGNAMNPNIEKIMTLNPDGIILSPFQNSGGYGKIEQLGVPIIEAADYMETSALGRAEWMIFYGILVGKKSEATRLFKQIEANYKRLMAKAETAPHPLVMIDYKQSSTWYVPGGGSTLGRMITDAGGQYAFSNDNHSGSVPHAFETMLEKNENADVWLIKYNASKDWTLSQLKTDNNGYTKFKPYQTGNVYGCNTDYVPFYEEVPFHPDFLLEDYLKIFNNKSDDLRYYKKLH